MKQHAALLFSSIFCLFSFVCLAQAPVMTSWVSDAANETQIQLRMHDRTINQGYALVEVSFDMSAARCALSDEVRIYVYQNDGVGSYGTVRYSVSFDPGPGTVPISTSEMTRILVVSVGSTEPIYARAVISGVSPADDFVLTTPDCITTIVTSDSYDPNESSGTASAIPSGTTHSGLLVNNDTDYYPVTLSSGNRNLVVTMSYWDDYRTTESNLDLDLYLSDGSGTLTLSNSSATSTSNPITESIDVILDPGTYYIVVRPKSTDPNRNFYTLNWDTFASPTYQISGSIQDDQNNDISGVVMSGLPGNPSTDVNGYYGVAVEHGWSGTVTPTLEGYSFEPANRTYTDVQEAHISDGYTATLDQFIISGRITDGTGSGEPGITLNGFPETVVTDPDGYYVGTVPYNWSGTIVPISASLVFSPSSIVYSEVRASITDQDYSSSIRTYTIEGNVITSTGTPLEGVTMDGFPELVLTNAAGDYSVEVDHGWSGTVTPTLTGYTFDPVSSSYTSVTAAQVQDYTATLNTHVIDGYVRTGGGTGIAGVLMSGLPGDPVTDATGYYSGNVLYGSSYTVTPTLAGWSFTPVSTAYSPVTGDATSDYTGTEDLYLTVNQHIIILGADSGTNSQVEVTSNVDWTVVCPESWITCTPESGSDDGSFTVTANSANPSTVARDATVTVSGGGISHNIDISQMGADPSLEVSSTTVSLGAAAASSQTIDITSNIAWTASETVDWLSVAPEGGTGDGSLTITTFLSNESVDDRSTTVVVSGSGITRNIEVTQAGADPILSVSAPSENLAATAGSNLTLNVSANIAWTASLDADWLSVSPANGSGDQLITVTADSANNDALERTATLNVEGSGMVRNITITQDGSDNTGIDDLFYLANLELYPNPARNLVFIKSDRTLQDEVHITVLSMAGNVMYESQVPRLIPGEPLEIDLTAFPVGQYLIQLDNRYIQRVFKVIKNE